jgi:hypothetical protein
VKGISIHGPLTNTRCKLYSTEKVFQRPRRLDSLESLIETGCVLGIVPFDVVQVRIVVHI